MQDPENSPEAFASAMNDRRAEPAKRAMSLPDDFASRPLGLILLAAASLAFVLNTYLPLSEAHAGADSISYSGKFVFIQPLFFVMGLVYTLFGERASVVLGPTSKPLKWGWILAAFLLGLCIAYLYLFQRYLAGLGYGS